MSNKFTPSSMSEKCFTRLNKMRNVLFCAGYLCMSTDGGQWPVWRVNVSVCYTKEHTHNFNEGHCWAKQHFVTQWRINTRWRETEVGDKMRLQPFRTLNDNCTIFLCWQKPNYTSRPNARLLYSATNQQNLHGQQSNKDTRTVSCALPNCGLGL